MRHQLLDVPSARSSHRHPTPRGGGLACVVVILAGLLAWAIRQGDRPAWLLVSFAGVVAVAFVGWLDDRRSVGVLPRLVTHLVAAGAVAMLATGLPGPLGASGPLGFAWWVLWTVAAINVTNFMDGIDGLIASQVAIRGVHFALLSTAGSSGSALGLLIAGACAGFLLWNWAPARIFLGDVGSGALGVCVVIGGVLAMRGSGRSLYDVFLPLYPLFLDALTTLVRRWRRGERLTESHRSHLYQRLANGGWGHARVSLLFAIAAVVGSVCSMLPLKYRPAAEVCFVIAVTVAGIGLERHLASRRPAQVA
jgi:UDP-N-acetylmuramyl pentapeptide phosphotransferase/UDP-N-acetylglucosamine-1-phosphate transferase